MDFLQEIKEAILIRTAEEQLIELFRKGKLNGTVHTCIGQEFTGIAVSKALQEDDYVFSNHRGHGHYLSRTKDLDGLFAELMGKAAGCSGGVGGSQHLYNRNYLSNGIQGGMTPIATGVALGRKMKGGDNVSVVFIGDGTFGEGILYEAFNIAARWQAPVVFVLENNNIAQSTSFLQTFAGSVEKRAEGFGLKFFHTTTDDLESLFRVTAEGVEYSRANSQPVLIEIQTGRLFSHSKSDDNRSAQSVEQLKAKDIIIKFSKSNPELYSNLKAEAEAVVAAAIERADKQDVLAYPCLEVPQAEAEPDYQRLHTTGGRINEEIYQFFRQKMEADDTVILIGEDIETANDYHPGEYGGAFRVTKDLSILYPGRVRNTPISEAAITGIGTGLALAGFRPVIEIMFGDFLTLTLDQLLQHAAKFRMMYNYQVKVPIVLRTPMGGHRGYGPTHSQSIEKFFLGIPDLYVAALNHRAAPGKIYEAIFQQAEVPFLVIENKIVYTLSLNGKPLTGFIVEQTNDRFPVIRIRPDVLPPDITILGYGGTLVEIEDAILKLFDEEEILCEVICPSLIHPIDISAIQQSVIKTGRLLIVEEGTSFAAWGSEIVTQLLEKGISMNKIVRLANKTIIPCSFTAEKNVLPTAPSISEAVKSMFA